MSDRDVFERRFEEAVREFAEAAPTEIDAARLTHALARDVPRVRRLVPLPVWRMPTLRFAWILVVLGALAMIGLGILASGATRDLHLPPVPPAPKTFESPSAMIPTSEPASPQPSPAAPAVIATPSTATPQPSVAASPASSAAVGVVLPSALIGSNLTPFQDALRAAGLDEQILFSSDAATEKADVEALIRRGARVLILCPQDGSAAAATVDEARAAGVRVIAYDRLIRNTAAVDFYVTFDNKAVGAAQAQYLIDMAGATRGNNLYLYAGAAADNNSYVFLEGAWETLQPRIADGTFVIRNSSQAVGLQGNRTLTREQQDRIIAQVTTEWNSNVASTVAAANLATLDAADKGTVFILAPNDTTARAIGSVFAADPDVTTLYVTGQDAEKASVQAIIDGTQGMTVFKDPRTLAIDAVAAARVLLDGGAPASTTRSDNGVMTVPTRLDPSLAVTKANVQATLFDSGFYAASDFTGTWPGKP